LNKLIEETLEARREYCGGLIGTEGLGVSSRQAALLIQGNVQFNRYPWAGWDVMRQAPVENSEFHTVTDLGFRFLKYTENKDNRQWLYLSGKCGVGKTHLASMLAVYWFLVNDAGKGWSTRLILPSSPVRFANWPEWLDQKRQSYSDRDVRQSVRDLTAAAFLVLDDVALELTAHSLKYLYLVLDGRKGKPTVITSNLKQGELIRALGHVKDSEAKDWAEKVISRLGLGNGSDLAAQIALVAKDSRKKEK